MFFNLYVPLDCFYFQLKSSSSSFTVTSKVANKYLQNVARSISDDAATMWHKLYTHHLRIVKLPREDWPSRTILDRTYSAERFFIFSSFFFFILGRAVD